MSKQASPSSQPSQPQNLQPSVDAAAVTSSIEAREQEQENIDQQQEQGIVTPQQSAREKELENELEVLRKQLAAQQGPAAKAVKEPAFKVPKGEEGYTHARVTKRGGVVLEQPIIMPFYPEQYEQISKTPGFEATVVHKGVEKE